MEAGSMSTYSKFRAKVSLVAFLLMLSGCASQSATFPGAEPFTQVTADFTHMWTKGTHPFTGASVIERATSSQLAGSASVSATTAARLHASTAWDTDVFDPTARTKRLHVSLPLA